MTPTEERELLELAAKARGIQLPPDRFQTAYNWGTPDDDSWNPFYDDGDCFDLAAHLMIDIYHRKGGSLVKELSVEVFPPLKDSDSIIELFNHESERPAATRLAVTRAAAEIGRGMKG